MQARALLCAVVCSTPALAGDFNCGAHEGAYRFLETGRLEGGYAEAYRPRNPVVAKTIVHPFLLSDIYARKARFQQQFSFGRPRGAALIDFVWASDCVAVNGVLQSLPPTKALTVSVKGIPDAVWPSDHVPLGAVLRVQCGARPSQQQDQGEAT